MKMWALSLLFMAGRAGGNGLIITAHTVLLSQLPSSLFLLIFAVGTVIAATSAASAALAIVTAVAAVVAVAVTMFIAEAVVAVAASASASVVAVTDTTAAFCHLLAATAAAEGADRLLETEI
jgi:hypothetical protein